MPAVPICGLTIFPAAGCGSSRITRSNHETELDNAVLLNYALGPKAQRLKHKDICESGSKGSLSRTRSMPVTAMESLYDYTEGIMDLMLLDDSIVDYYGRPELIFFGPDEGTAPLMDAVALRAKDRGYPYWRTITTGKSFGIPHDTYRSARQWRDLRPLRSR